MQKGISHPPPHLPTPQPPPFTSTLKLSKLWTFRSFCLQGFAYNSHVANMTTSLEEAQVFLISETMLQCMKQI